jgi:hypothetical protein
VIYVNGVELGGSSGSVASTDITDSTSVGRAVLTVDPTALPVAPVADWRLWTLSQGDTVIPNATAPGTYDLTANAAAAARLGYGSDRGATWSRSDHQEAIADLRSIGGAGSLSAAAWTVAVWVKLAETPVTFGRYLVLKRHDDAVWSPGSYADIGVVVDPTLKLGVETSGAQSISSEAMLPIGVWSLVVVTYDGTTLRLYLDGSLVGSAATSAPSWGAGSWGVAGQPVGGSGVVWSQGLPGLCDRCVIWTSALTAAQVRALASLTRYPWPT